MNTVLKYPLPLYFGAKQTIVMPARSEILTFQMQGDIPTIWALVDPSEQEREERHMQIVGTGHKEVEPEGSLYIGTVQDRGLVWHLFEQVNR